MATLQYLWKNRRRFDAYNTLCIKAWAKRVLTLPEVLGRNRKRQMLIRKGAQILETAEIGEATFIGNPRNLMVGTDSFIGRAEIALHDKVTIGNNVCINDGVKLLTGTHDTQNSQWSLLKKPIRINSHVWIAVNAIILPGVEIGEGAIIGAGAVVGKNVAPFSIVTGNPAKALPKKRVMNLDYNPCQSLASYEAWING